jgi:hypothetical protein
MGKETDGKGIYTAIPAVMGEIGAIGKDRKNPQQGYQFRGIDDIYNAVNAALVKHGVFCVPFMEDMKREERQTQKGGTLLYTILTMRYTFFASDGSSIEAKTVGEAMDSGDKSCNKAMSAAQKYAFLELFCIPTEEPKDTEEETHEVKGREKEGGENVRKLMADEMIAAINETKHITHLKNWWEKHKPEVEALPIFYRTLVVTAKENRKTILQEREE